MKKNVFYLLLLFTILPFVVSSCKDDNDDPTPPEPSPSITIASSENLNPVLSQEGGTVSISFTTTAEWTASLINTRAESWVTITPTSGSKGKNDITITATANETYDERNATIVLKCGTDSKNIVVTQKQKDALTVTSSKYEVDGAGGTISVEVKANINFEVEVKAGWIKQQTGNTRALTTSNLSFAVEPNETGDQREGEIIIKSGELSETINVYQGFEDFITLTQKEFTLPEEGGNVDIEIRSTLDYAVKMIPDVDWITEAATRAVSTHTHHYSISPNETYDAREAKIVFYDPKDENMADTVSIYQMYKGAILVARNEYQFDVKGGILNLAVQTNLEFDVEVSDSWIQQVQPTRGLTEYNLSFTIAENTDQADRDGIITIKDRNSDKKQVITVKQTYIDLEREALIALYNATDGDNWINNTNWCSDKPISEWYGIWIQDGNLFIYLDNNNLTGKLPAEIGNLKNLTLLSLTANNLSGSIPEDIGRLSNIEALELSQNSLEGNIPECIGNLTELRRLNLWDNKLSGTLPDGIGNLKNLERLDISINQISGELPESIGNLINLKQLIISGNQFAGILPESIGNLVNLTGLIIDSNQFTGTFPESMKNLVNLQSLHASYCNFEGSIPEWIEDFPFEGFEALNLQMNRFSGSVSMEMWNRWGTLISLQQTGYIVSPEDYYVSTDFSKDGEITVMQTHSKGNGIKLVLMGDLFVDKDMGTGGKYETLMNLAMENFFSIEPVKSLREYFDVIAIKAVSENDWMSGKTAFETMRNNTFTYNEAKCWQYAVNAVKAIGSDLNNTHIILVNLGAGGQTSMGGTTSLACCQYRKDDPDYFKELIYHETVGHGIGLLYDEYTFYSGTIPTDEASLVQQEYNRDKWYSNVDFTTNPSNVKWAHFMSDSRYSDEGIGIYEGALWESGIYRPTEYSIMREGIWENGITRYVVNQFNAPSREAIYRNIMRMAYGNSWTYDYEEFVKLDAQGHADWVEAINKIEPRSMQQGVTRNYKHIPPKIYNYPAVVK